MDWNTIATIVVFLVLPWFLPMLATLCLYLYKRGIAALPPAQRAEAVRITQMAVNAIEQAMGEQPGSVKRQQAIDAITNTLKAAKITVPANLINIALEDAVHTLNTPAPQVVVEPAPAQVQPAPPPYAPAPLPIEQQSTAAEMPAVIVSQPWQPPAPDIAFGDTNAMPAVSH